MPIMWGGDDPYTHLLCVGPTRCGKSSTVLEPIMYQLLVQKKRGKKVGFSLIEPKGDLVRNVKEYCDVMEIPYIYIDPESPNSHRFNVMEGDKDDVAEATVAVLQSLFGKQQDFFQTVQELSTRYITKLLKELRGDDLDLMDVLETLRDERLLAKRVEELRVINPNSDLIPFFDNELLGSLKDHYRKLVVGLRAQLENITGNERLRRIITGKSDINLDEHLENGEVLLVNTSLGRLRKAGDAFGQFVIMHLQNATFRRKGTERTRIPHFLIADEYRRYINPDVELFLSLAASYRVAGIFATQSLANLEVESGNISAKAMKQTILTNCRNKIAFCGLSAQDAKEFAEEFGKDRITMRQSTYKNRIFLPRWFPESYRDTEIEEYRYHYTYLQDSMKRFHFLCRIMKDGTPQRPFEGIGQFVPRNWKELREWENKKEKTPIFTNVEKVVDLFQLKKSKNMQKTKTITKTIKEETRTERTPTPETIEETDFVLNNQPRNIRQAEEEIIFFDPDSENSIELEEAAQKAKHILNPNAEAEKAARKESARTDKNEQRLIKTKAISNTGKVRNQDEMNIPSQSVDTLKTLQKPDDEGLSIKNSESYIDKYNDDGFF